jgi:inorganic triphosphatase YgiF
MKEIELKFQIPADRVEAVKTHILALSDPSGQAAQTLPLHAAYFDTTDHRLARQRCALRVRREGDEWVQTFKGAGADAMTRLEENQQVLPPPDGRPAPDLSCHGPQVQAALARVLNWSPEADPKGLTLGLRALYETRFERLHTTQTAADGSGSVVVCLDQGMITAGELVSPLAELELELKDGPPLALLALASDWVDTHGLWLDVQSKAMKGTRLAQSASSGQAVKAQALHLPSDWMQTILSNTPQAAAARRQALSNCLDVAAGNWAEVALSFMQWEPAFTAWHDTLHSLHLAARQQELALWLGQPVVQETQHLLDALAALNHSPTEAAAQALATSATPTRWALAVLTRLNQAMD